MTSRDMTSKDMTSKDAERSGGAPPRPRRLVCEICGTAFGCTLDGPCWCSQEPFRMPLPPAGGDAPGPKDCLCPACLRARAVAIR